MAEILKLNDIRQKQNQAAIALLRDALDRAERGDIVDVIMLVEYSDGVWDCGNTPTPDLFTLVGRLEALKQRTFERMREKRDEDAGVTG